MEITLRNLVSLRYGYIVDIHKVRVAEVVKEGPLAFKAIKVPVATGLVVRSGGIDISVPTLPSHGLIDEEGGREYRVMVPSCGKLRLVANFDYIIVKQGDGYLILVKTPPYPFQ